MQLTTMCYIRRPGEVLMLHRVKKKVDINKGKWIGVGGHLEAGESPEECIIREIREETGLIAHEPKLRGLITFNFQNEDPELADWETEYMFVFTCDDYAGEVDFSCEEGDLAWVKEEVLPTLPLWEGDTLYMPLALSDNVPFFSMKMVYRGDELLKWTMD